MCIEAGIPLEGSQPLILAWQFKAQEMAKLRRSEWLQGTEALRYAHELFVLAGLADCVHKNFVTLGLGNGIEGAR